MNKIVSDISSVARFEALRTLGSVRGLLVLMLYLTASALSGGFYVTVVRSLEEKAVELVQKSGGSTEEAKGPVDITKLPQYQSMIDSFAGEDKAKAELWKTTPPIVLVSFWLALGFLPFLVMLTSHDTLARDNELRTLRYVRPKLPMASWVVGKFLAQALLIFAVTVASGAVIYAIGVARLETFPAGEGAIAFLAFWWRVLVYELAVLGVLFIVSALSRTAFGALVLSALAIFALWLLQFFSWWKDGDELTPMGYLSYLSPFTYKEGLWYPVGQSLAMAAAAQVGFALLGIAASIYALQKRDI